MVARDAKILYISLKAAGFLYKTQRLFQFILAMRLLKFYHSSLFPWCECHFLSFSNTFSAAPFWVHLTHQDYLEHLVGHYCAKIFHVIPCLTFWNTQNYVAVHSVLLYLVSNRNKKQRTYIPFDFLICFFRLCFFQNLTTSICNLFNYFLLDAY